MTTIAFAPRAEGYEKRGTREMLGAKKGRVAQEDTIVFEPKPIGAPVKLVPSEIEKAVRRMPTLYVIAFFAVVVSCAVLIIWNTLQVNKLTAERTKLDDQIAQTEQRLIRLRAEEMQLSAPTRVREIARQKLGMMDATSEDIVTVK
jgi:cell division protein FtsL